MGFFDSLTKTGLDYGYIPDPITGQMVPVPPKYFPSRAAAGMSLAKAAAQTAEPSRSDIQGNIGEPYLSQGVTMTPAPVESAMPDQPEMMNAPDQTQISDIAPSGRAVPRMFKPSFQQASTDATGMQTPNTPGLTRLGKLMQVLGAAAKGALAGQAASEETLARSGGRISGGFGTGAMAALQQPYQEAAMRQGVEHGQLQNQMERAQIAALPWLRALQMQHTQAQTNQANALAAWRNWQIQNGKATPEEQIGAKVKIAQNAGLDPDETKQFVYGIKPAMEKPDTATQMKQKQAGIVSKLESAGELLPGSLTDVNKLMQSIKSSKTLTDQEKSDSVGYLATNTTPPSQGTNVIIRSDEFAKTRGLQAVLDTQTGVAKPMSWDQYNKASAAEPNRYVSPQWDAEAKAAIAGATNFGRDIPNQTRSFGTFIGHAGDLSDAINDLRNTRSPWLNTAWNDLRKGAAGSPAIARFLAKVDPVRKEFESFLINNRALTVEDRQRGLEILNENSNPAAMQDAIRSFMHTALIRLDELNNTWYGQTGNDYPNLLSPKAAKILENFGFGKDVDVYRQRGMIGGSLSKRLGTNQATPTPKTQQNTGYAQGFSPL